MAGTESIASAVRAIANAVVDTLAHLGVTNIDIPITAPKVWAVLKEKSVALEYAVGARIDFPLQ